MEHDLSLISTVAVGFGLALVFGLLADRLRLPPLVGYLFAGVLIGPATPGYVADVGLAGQLAEIGVMLLMFGVGLHFSLDDLLAVRRLAVPGAILQMAVATALGAAMASAWGWSPAESLVFGLCLSVASTVVLLRALEATGRLESTEGRIAVGWLVVEDLAMVLVLVLLPPLADVLGAVPQGLSAEAAGTAAGAGAAATATAAGGGAPWTALATTLLRVGAFVALMLVVGRRVLPWLLWRVSRTGSRELFTLTVVAGAIGIAFGAAQLFSVSFALGAFFAGTVMRESEFGARAAEESLPLRDAFAVLFFVSVGMLFDPAVLLSHPLEVLGTVAVIVIGKSVAAAGLVLACRYPLRSALTVSASLAQIGEFSFILAGLGGALGLLPPQATSLVVAGALISIALNPLVMAGSEPTAAWLRRRFAFAARLDARPSPLAALPSQTAPDVLAGQVVLVGHGKVGARIAAELREAGVPLVVVERRREAVERLREQGIAAVAGDGTDPVVLVQAHVAHAAVLVVAISDTVGLARMVETARRLNPDIEVVARAHDEDESAFIRRDGVGEVFLPDATLARAMARHVLARGTATRTAPAPGAEPSPAARRTLP